MTKETKCKQYSKSKVSSGKIKNKQRRQINYSRNQDSQTIHSSVREEAFLRPVIPNDDVVITGTLVVVVDGFAVVVVGAV